MHCNGGASHRTSFGAFAWAGTGQCICCAPPQVWQFVGARHVRAFREPMPSAICNKILSFLLGDRGVAYVTHVKEVLLKMTNKAWCLADTVKDVLPASDVDTHPFEVLQREYRSLPALDTLASVLAVDLGEIKRTILKMCREMPMFKRCIVRGVWRRSLEPPLRLILAMQQWNIGGLCLRLLTPGEAEEIWDLFFAGMDPLCPA